MTTDGPRREREVIPTSDQCVACALRDDCVRLRAWIPKDEGDSQQPMRPIVLCRECRAQLASAPAEQES